MMRVFTERGRVPIGLLIWIIVSIGVGVSTIAVIERTANHPPTETEVATPKMEDATTLIGQVTTTPLPVVERTGNEKYGCPECRYVYWQQIPNDKGLICDRCFSEGRALWPMVYLGTQPREGD